MSRSVAILFLALSLAACSATSQTTTAGGSAPPSSPAVSPAKTPVEEAGLVGAWTTPAISAADVRHTLTAAGLGKTTTTVTEDISFPISFVLEIDPTSYHVQANGSGIDHGTLAVDGQTLTLSPTCAGCAIVYTYALTGDELTLTFVSDTSPEYKGVPDAAFQRAIYTTAAFTRE